MAIEDSSAPPNGEPTASGAPESVSAVVAGGETGDAAYRRLVGRFATVCAAEPEIASIYVLRPTDQPGMLAFVADHVAHGNVPPAVIGRLYDATRAQHELDAFHGPVVESQPYTDEWGTVLSGYAPVRDARGEAIAIVGVDVFATRLDEMRASLPEAAAPNAKFEVVEPSSDAASEVPRPTAPASSIRAKPTAPAGS